MLQSNAAGDISLENIMIMQKAEAESWFMTCVYASGRVRSLMVFQYRELGIINIFRPLSDVQSLKGIIK